MDDPQLVNHTREMNQLGRGEHIRMPVRHSRPGFRFHTAVRLIGLAIALATFAAAATERSIAEWAIRQGGRVVLDDKRAVLDDLSQLPPGPFHITGLDLVGTTIEPKDLVIISRLPALRDLALPGPSWTPSSGSEIDENEQLKYLAGLTTLERLSFSLHFLPTFNIQDGGIARLKTLTGLKELRLAQSQVVKPDLTPFVTLAVSRFE